MVDRVSTASVFSNTISTFGNAQTELARLTRQISSGVEASDFKELGSKTRLVLDLESKFSRTSGYIENNKVVLIRLSRMGDSMSQLLDVATSFRNNLVNERSAAGDALPLTDLTKAQLGQVRDALNTSVNGRFLFGGHRTDVPPVDDITLTSNMITPSGNPVLPTSEIPGVISSNYYQGDNGAVSVRATDQLTIDYGITADDTTFQQLIGAMNLAIQGETQGDDELLAQAVDLLNTAIDGIINYKNQINSNVQVIEGVNDLHENFSTYLTQTIGDQVGVDVAEASIQLSLNQTILQATFQNFARVSSLNLVNFLK